MSDLLTEEQLMQKLRLIQTQFDTAPIVKHMLAIQQRMEIAETKIADQQKLIEAADKMRDDLGTLQTMIGEIRAWTINDRDPMRMDKMIPAFEEAFELCVSSRHQYQALLREGAPSGRGEEKK